MDPENPAIDSIVETLTEKLYSHDYLISRREARTIGLKVEDASAEVEAAVGTLYDEYEKDLQLREAFNPMGQLAAAAATPGQPPQVRVQLDRALVESTGRSDVFRTELTLQPHPQGLQTIPHFEGWKTL